MVTRRANLPHPWTVCATGYAGRVKTDLWIDNPNSPPPQKMGQPDRLNPFCHPYVHGMMLSTPIHDTMCIIIWEAGDII